MFSRRAKPGARISSNVKPGDAKPGIAKPGDAKRDWQEIAYYLLVIFVFLISSITSYVLEVWAHIEPKLQDQIKNASDIFNINFFQSIAEEVAIASAIALFLAFTIEKFSSRRFAKETERAITKIKENVLEAVYGNHIPRFLFDEVREEIFEARFVRHQYEVTYTLELLADDKHYIKEIVRLAYTVENLSYDDQSYPVGIEIELPKSSKLREKCKLIDMTVDGVSFKDLQPDPADPENTGYISYTNRVDIKGRARSLEEQTSEAKPSKEIVIDFQSFFKPSERRAWRSTFPADGFKFTVKSKNNLHACLTPFMKSKPKVQHNPHVDEYVWSFSGAIYPNLACFEYWWEQSGDQDTMTEKTA